MSGTATTTASLDQPPEVGHQLPAGSPQAAVARGVARTF